MVLLVGSKVVLRATMCTTPYTTVSSSALGAASISELSCRISRGNWANLSGEDLDLMARAIKEAAGHLDLRSRARYKPHGSGGSWLVGKLAGTPLNVAH